MKLFTRKEEQARQDMKLDIVRQEELKISQTLQEKIGTLNSFNVSMDTQIAAKKSELLQAQTDFSGFTNNKLLVIEGLEARKKEALAPIVKELEELDAKRKVIIEGLSILELKELEDTERKERLSSQEAVFRIHEAKTLKSLAEREEEVAKREQGLIGKTEEARAATVVYSLARTVITKKEVALQIKSDALEKREMDIASREEALKKERVILDKQAAKLKSVEARLIAARYANN